MAISNSAVSNIYLLKRMPLFSSLSDADLREVSNHTGVRFAHKGEALFQKGDRALHFYGVASGWVKVFNRHENGEEAILSVFSTGETFAEAAMFLSGTYPASAEAIEDSRLLEFDHHYFQHEIYSRPALCRGMLASMAKHLHAMAQEVEHMKVRTSQQRLARFLVKLCQSDEGPCTIKLPYDKNLIASRLGMKAETLSRVFSKLKPHGVSVDRHQVTIANPQKLLNHTK